MPRSATYTFIPIRSPFVFPVTGLFSLTVLLSILSLLGCSPKNNVKEIDNASSGITIGESILQRSDNDWWCWRGPKGNGIASNQEIPIEWSESKNVLWNIDIPGRGHSSPIVVDDLVILATSDNSDTTQKLLAFDRKTGKSTWATTVHTGGWTPQNKMHNKSTQANSTPASNGEQVFITFLNKGAVYLTAVDLEGQQLWQTEIGAFQSKFGYAPSPTMYKSFVIVAADNQGGGHISAVDSATGKIAWRITRSTTSSYSTPTVANVGGRDQLLISGCGSISSFDPATGESLWETAGMPEATCGTIVTTDDKIFASGGYPQKKTACFDSEGNELWSNRTKFYEPSMIVVDDILFGVNDGGIAHAWDITDGRALWQKRVGGSFSSSPVLCNGHVYVSDLSGNTHVFEVTRDSLIIVATNRLGKDVYASPAVSNDCIFIRYGQEKGGRVEKLACLKLQD